MSPITESTDTDSESEEQTTRLRELPPSAELVFYVWSNREPVTQPQPGIL